MIMGISPDEVNIIRILVSCKLLSRKLQFLYTVENLQNSQMYELICCFWNAHSWIEQSYPMPMVLSMFAPEFDLETFVPELLCAVEMLFIERN